MSTQAIMQSSEEIFKATNIKEMQFTTKVLAYLHSEINYYQKLYTMYSLQFANKLFKDKKEAEETLENIILECQSKLSAYRNGTEKISMLLKEDNKNG